MRKLAMATATGLLLCFAACSGTPPSNLPYDPEQTRVISPDGEVEVVPTPSGGDCLVLADGPRTACIPPQTQCDVGWSADVILDSAGNVLETICLPTEDD